MKAEIAIILPSEGMTAKTGGDGNYTQAL